MPTKLRNGRWKVDVRPEGKYGPRVQKRFRTHAEATRFESFVLGAAVQGLPWNPKPADSRLLSELIELWVEHHGKHLKDIDRRRAVLDAICEALGNPRGAGITASDFSRYRSSKKGVGDRPVSPKTLNNHLGYMSAVFSELQRLDVIDYQNPLKKLKAIKLQERELAFLSIGEIHELMSVIENFSENPHVLLLTKICLSTGCRWGEAEALTLKRVRDCRLQFTQTKGRKTRFVPISEDLQTEILEHAAKHGDGGKIFSSSMGAFGRAVKQLSFDIPRGQKTHVLRHTFASHFVMRGGDLLALMKILGHSTILMTMRYAHLAPDHLVQAIKLNALSLAGGLQVDEIKDPS